MALCASSIGLCNPVYLLDDCNVGADFVKRCSENMIVEVKESGGSRSPKFGYRISITKAFFPRCMSNRRKQKYEIRNTLVPQEVAPESADPPVGMAPKEQLHVSGVKDSLASETGSLPELDHGNSGGDSLGGNGGNGKFPPGGGGGGEHEENDEEEKEFGPLMKFEEVMREVEKRGATLPSDMLEAAKTIGIREKLLLRYLDSQGPSVWPLGFAMKSFSFFRNRMLADPHFLFKIGTEIVIDSCCATFAEIQKRGKDFWAEFELYVADLLVGVVVNVALVSLLAPYARIGQPSMSKGFFGSIQHAYAALPSSVFEAESSGCKFSIQQRIGTYFYKGVLYGSVGFACGLVGQGIANLIMTAKRSGKKSEDDIPVPPLVKSAALWGVFLAVSSNTRYQIINGLESLVEASPLAKRVPPVAFAFTVGVRFANNVYGGMQFVDWARWSGVQ